MFVISQKERGIALFGSNYCHVFTGEEWGTYSQEVVAAGLVKAHILADGPVGQRQFDLIRAAHTQHTT